MPEERPSPEELEAARLALKKANQRIEGDKKRISSEPLVQEFSFDPASENKREIENLQEENTELKKTIEELKKYFGERLEKVEQELKDLRKLIEEESAKQ